jgi:hypothetical protein
VDKSFVLGQISDDYGFSKLQIVYYPKGKLEFVKRGVIPIRIDGYDQFYFLFRKLAVEQGVSSIILRSLTMMHEMFQKLKDACVLIVL